MPPKAARKGGEVNCFFECRAFWRGRIKNKGNIVELKLSDDLTLTVDRHSEGITETEYVFTVEEKSTGKTGTQTIKIKEFEHVDFKNYDILEASSKESLESFWKSYKDISNLNELGEIAYLIPYVLSKFGIK
ncbi:hypothetical protein [Treponema berlinense]|uniref:hypothetical protein n=1 Tax=Treponema berlinense TaxID=225004 RepID=UPI0026F30720|nr:hypothetical protein [Treponema berlinense]